MSVAQNIIEIIEQHLPPPGTARVSKVNLRLGRMSGIVADSLEFCFEAITRDTALGESKLEMEFTPLVIRCHVCGRESEIQEPYFICPECSSTQVDIVSGTELQVVGIEIEELNPG